MITNEIIKEICFDSILSLWEEQSEEFPDFLNELPEDMQKENEQTMTQLQKNLQKSMWAFPLQQEKREIWKKEFEQIMGEFVQKENILSVRKAMSQELFAGFDRETKHFVRRSREFDQTLTMDDIWQALRNFLIYAVLADLQGDEQNCDDPILAYSLLYPYTDNFLDNRANEEEGKHHYNAFIQAVIQGEEITPENEVEEKTKMLLDMILSYPGFADKEEARNALLLILDAQKRSIKQQCSETLRKEEIQEISVYKGATSVYVDYIFSTLYHNRSEAEFYLQFGFMLQLVDDLQDIQEDQREGSQTLMTYSLKNGQLENITNKLLHFIHVIYEQFEPRNGGLKEFMLQNCYQMVLVTAAMNDSLYSKEYLLKIMPYLPFRTDYLREYGNRRKTGGQPLLFRNMNNRMEILDTISSV